MPFFTPGDDPGPDFAALVRRLGLAPEVPTVDVADRLAITHGTTVVAIRYADGVVMAGDRRATATAASPSREPPARRWRW
jgi:proteasome beta subunit